MQAKDTKKSPQKYTLRSLILKHNIIFNGISFDQDLRKLKKASSDQIAKGEMDVIFKRCLRYCSYQKNRFLLHKLAYTLFSEASYSFRTDNQHINILRWLISDPHSELPVIIRVLQDTFQEWKKSPSNKSQNCSHPFSDDKKEIIRILGNLFPMPDKINLTKDEIENFYEFQLSEKDSPFARATHKVSLLKKLEEILLVYLEPGSKALQILTNFTQKIENLQGLQTISATEIRETLNALRDQLYLNIKIVGVVPRNKAFPSTDKADLSHGGGLFYLNSFLLGKNQGYKLDVREGGLGIYLDPNNGKANLGDSHYATLHPVIHFDLPVALKCTAKLSDLDTSVRKDEAILRHVNRKKLTITELNMLPVDKIHGLKDLSPDVLKLYPAWQDQDLRLLICKSAIRLYQMSGNDERVRVWENEYYSETNSTHKLG